MPLMVMIVIRGRRTVILTITKRMVVVKIRFLRVIRRRVIETCSAHCQNWETVDLSEAINLSSGTRPDDSTLRLEIPAVS